jgi:hypothetical protein
MEHRSVGIEESFGCCSEVYYVNFAVAVDVTRKYRVNSTVIERVVSLWIGFAPVHQQYEEV